MRTTMFQKYTAYKDSGVEWLGEIPEHWELLSNKNIFKLKKNQVGKKSADYTLLSLTLKGIINRVIEDGGKFPAEFDTYQEVKKGDFVFCLFDVEETPRCVGLSDFEGMITGAYTVMEVKSNFDRKFLYYFYLNLDADKRMRPLYTGLRNTISKDNFFAFKTFVPPLREQTAIAAFLDEKTAKIDHAIAQKEKMIALLKERKQIIIQDLVTGKKVWNAPQNAWTEPAEVKDSGVEWIGEIPEGWEVPKMKHLCHFILDGTHGSFPRVENGYRLLSVRNIIDGKFVFRDDDSMVSSRHFKEISSKFEIQEGDIQLAIVGATMGKVAIVENLSERIVTQRSLSTLRVNKSKCMVKYISYFIQSELFQSFLWNNTGFSAQPGIYLGTIQNAYLPIPPIQEQTAIVAHIETQSAKIDKAIGLQEQQIEKLKELKATLIDGAVTGKIKITD